MEYKKLGEFCEIKRGETITKKHLKNGNIPVIAGGLTPLSYHNISNRDGNIITVSGSGVNAGFVNFWKEPIFLSDAFSINANNLLNQKFLYYFLKKNQKKIYDMKQGAGIPHVYVTDVSKLKIPIPPIHIQEYIVGILDKFDKLVNDISCGLPYEIELRQKEYEYFREKLLDF